jgi:hypothetical protein
MIYHAPNPVGSRATYLTLYESGSPFDCAADAADQERLALFY